MFRIWPAVRFVASALCVSVLAMAGPAGSNAMRDIVAASAPQLPVLTNPGHQSHGDSSVSYAEGVLDDAPVGYWRLGETAGTNAADSAGTQAGTLVGGVTPDQPGPLADANPAMLLNGSTGHIRVSSGPALQLAGDLTIEMWMHVSLATRRACPPGPAVAAALAPVLAGHARLPLPAGAGRAIG